MKMKKILALLLVALMAVNQIAPVAYAVGNELTCTCTDRSGSEFIKFYPATCTTEGYNLFNHPACGKQYTEFVEVALGHDIVSHAAQAPTCTEIGWEAYETCTRCNYTTYTKISEKGHTPDGRWQIGHKVPATCTTKGSYTEYQLCSVCGEVAVENPVTTPVMPHAEVKHDEVLADCLNDGHSAYTSCKNCEWTEGYEFYPALGHTADDAVLEGTGFCHEGNLYWVTYCADCGAEMSRDLVSPKHAYYTPDHKEVDCLNPEMDVYTCYICNYVWENTFGEALGHDYKPVVTDPTCTDQGYTTYTCSRCDHSYVDNYVPALNHKYSEKVTKPTCTDQGYTTYTCSVCQDSYTGDFVAELGHDYHGKVTEPTCIDKGYTTYTCSRCEDSYDADYTDPNPANHDIQITTPFKAPTCSAEGNEAGYSCVRCGKVQQEATVIPVNPDAHKYNAVVTDPTCTAQGYTTYTCKYDATHTYVDDYVDALGHKAAKAVEENRVEATCTVDGSYEMVVYCSVCEEELSRDSYVIPAPGHKAAEAKEENRVEATCTVDGSYEMVVYCSVCEEELSRVSYVIPAPGHKAAEAKEENRVEPTCTVDGSYEMAVYCSVCEEELSRVSHVLPALGHDKKAHKAQAPTCTEIGWEAYETCTRCDYTTYDELPELGHEMHPTYGRVDPTCTVDAYDIWECARCEYEEIRYEEGTALGHTEADAKVRNYVAATCTEDGSYEEVIFCAVCREELSSKTEVIPATGHTAGRTQIENAVAETCTTAGSHDEFAICTVCGEEVFRVTKTFEALGHKPGRTQIDNVVAETCTEAGSHDEFAICTVCGEEAFRVTKTFEALGHDEIAHDAQAQTCTEIGWDAYVTCSRCDYTTYVELPALGHTIVNHDAQAPTCTEDGWIAYETCEACDYNTCKIVPATGHTTTGRVQIGHIIPATCTTEGSYEEYENCADCGEVAYSNTVITPVMPHDLVKLDPVAPTFDETGLTYGEYCLNCDYALEQEIVDRLSEEVTFTYEATGINGSVNAVNSGFVTLNVYMNVNTEIARLWGIDLGIAFNDDVTLLGAEGSTFTKFSCTDIATADANNFIKMTLDMDRETSNTFDAGNYLVATLSFKVSENVYAQDVSFTVIGDECDASRRSDLLNTLFVDFGSGASIYVDMLGDANGDGKITTQDNLMLYEWMTSDIEDDAYNYIFDMNKDGYIDIADQAAIRGAIVGVYDYLYE